jgi:signal peptidase I
MSAIGELLRGLFSLASFGVLVALILKVFFVDVITIPHNGMAPTLLAGEQVAVWRNARANMADIMVCQHPANPAASVIGRAIAFAGHRVSTDSYGNLQVDEDRASLDWGQDIHFYDVTRQRLYTMRLGSVDYRRQNRHQFMIERDTTFAVRAYQVNHGIYLLGDNRSDTIDDSREFGEVDPAKCQGQIFMRLLPAPDRGDDVHHSYFDVLL